MAGVYNELPDGDFEMNVRCPYCDKRSFAVVFREHVGSGAMVPGESDTAQCNQCGRIYSVTIKLKERK